MNNEEKNVVTKKNNKLGTVLIILIIILIGVLSFIAGYCISTNKLDDKEIINQEENDTSSNKVVVELDSLESAEFIKLYENIQPGYYNFTDGYADLGFYYHDNDKILTSNMDNRLKMSLSVKLLFSDFYYDVHRYENSNGDFQIPEKLLKDAYHLLFGNNSEYKFTEVNTECPGILKKSLNNELYPLKDGDVYIATQCGDTGVDKISQKVVKLEKTKDQKELYIYEEFAYLDYKYDEVNKKDYFDYYKDKDKKILIGSTKDESYEEISKKNQMNIYKYTFKYQPTEINKSEYYQNPPVLHNNLSEWRSHKDYYFYSVEKIK